jgi:methylated-DNA-[protein]-cysteine S-methyltransferase
MTQTFAQKVYSQLRKVPKGKITTYKDLAQSLGSKAYRAVGTAMKNNPDAPHTPCHRVVSANGTVGGFKGEKEGKSISEKIVLLRNEGVEVVGGKIKNFEEKLHSF